MWLRQICEWWWWWSYDVFDEIILGKFDFFFIMKFWQIKDEHDEQNEHDESPNRMQNFFVEYSKMLRQFAWSVNKLRISPNSKENYLLNLNNIIIR